LRNSNRVAGISKTETGKSQGFLSFLPALLIGNEAKQSPINQFNILIELGKVDGKNA
jgi:hypothetical protein